MDRRLVELNAGQTPREAEGWLTALAAAGLLAHREQDHPRLRGRRISTWWLPVAPVAAPTEVAPPEGVAPPEAAVPEAAAPPASETEPAAPPEPAAEPARPRTIPRREWDPFRLRGSLAYVGRPAAAGVAGGAD